MAIGDPDQRGGAARLSLSVYLELMTILGAYREALVLVGGWAPYFILERFGREDTDFRHIGSVDIDIAVNPRLVSPDEYASIVERLERRGYRQRLDKLGQPIPFIFERKVELGEGRPSRIIEVDFLAPEYGGTGKKHRHQRIQDDLLARKARGCDIVFDHCFDYELKGVLPGGAENTVKVKIAGLVGCLTMKGIVLGERYHEKDAYDIYSVITYYRGGPGGAAQEVKPHLGNSLVHEGIDNIAEKFQSIRSIGPAGVGNFLAADSAERDRLAADAFVNVGEFIKALKE
ncbi:MAG: hypothetical protein U9R11_03550 [Chloroflexota bacterium]|nr:hypothetical protein [Chloroflexota bacterium]